MKCYYRIKLQEKEYETLQRLLQEQDPEFAILVHQNSKLIIIDEQKKGRTKQAIESKMRRSKEKIQNAINLLLLEGRDINPYSVSQIAEVSYATAKKYLKELPNIKKLNRYQT